MTPIAGKKALLYEFKLCDNNERVLQNNRYRVPTNSFKRFSKAFTISKTYLLKILLEF